MVGKNEYGSFSITPTSYKVDDGGGLYRIELRVKMSLGWIEQVYCYLSSYTKSFVVHLKFKQMLDDDAIFVAEEVYLENSPRYLVYFTFLGSGQYYVFKKFDYYGKTSTMPEEVFQFSVGFRVPEWAKGATMYHIFVDSYYRDWSIPLPTIEGRVLHKEWLEEPLAGPNKDGKWCMDYYGGNLKGIQKCLKYIKRLGVDIIFLSPLVDSYSNHRYDANDFEKVDPFLGTNESKKQFCEAAHSLGMYVIEDVVFDHVGRYSKYFNAAGIYPNAGAFQDPFSDYGKFFFFNEDGKVSCWWNDPNLPQTDGNSEPWREYIFGGPSHGIVGLMYRLGIDGVRLDVPDNLLDTFIEGITEASYASHPNPFILGEIWENVIRKDRTFLTSGKGMHSVMNYFLHGGLIKFFKYADYNDLYFRAKEIIAEYPLETRQTNMNFTSTHDISRLVDIYSAEYTIIDDDGNINLGGSKDNASEKLIFNRDDPRGPWTLFDESPEFANAFFLPNWKKKLGKKMMMAHVTFIAFYEGIFTIYYGDEVGATGIGNLKNRGSYPWGRRDKKQLKFFRRIGKARNSNPFLKTADQKIPVVTKYTASYERIGETNSLFVIVSRSRFPRSIEIPDKYKDGKIIFKLGNSTKLNLAPYGALVIKI